MRLDLLEMLWDMDKREDARIKKNGTKDTQKIHFDQFLQARLSRLELLVSPLRQAAVGVNDTS